MSAASVYKYVIEINPDDLNEIDAKINRMEELSEQFQEGEGPSTLTKETMEELLKTIKIGGSRYSEVTRVYDDVKINSILKTVDTTRDLVLILYRRLTGMDDIADLTEQIEGTELNIFKLTEDLTKLDATIRSGGMDAQVARTTAVEKDQSLLKIGLTNEAIQQLSSRVVQSDIVDRIRGPTGDPTNDFDRIFSEKANETLRESINQLKTLSIAIDNNRQTTETWLKRRQELDEQIDVGAVTYKDAATRRAEMDHYMEKLNKEAGHLFKQADKETRSMSGSAGYFKTQAPAKLTKHLVDAKINEPSTLDILNDLLLRYVDTIDIKDFQGEKPMDDILKSFLEIVAGLSDEDTLLNSGIAEDINRVVSAAVQRQIFEYLNLPPDTTMAERGAVISTMFSGVASVFAGSMATPRDEEISHSMKDIQTMMNTFIRITKAAVTSVNNAVQAGVEGQEPAIERDDSSKEIIDQLEVLGANITGAVNALKEQIEGTDPKSELRTG